MSMCLIYVCVVLLMIFTFIDDNKMSFSFLVFIILVFITLIYWLNVINDHLRKLQRFREVYNFNKIINWYMIIVKASIMYMVL